MSSCPCLSNEKKLYISVQTAVIAFVLFNPVTLKLFGGSTQLAVAIAAVLFTVILYFLMRPTSPPKNQRQTVPGLPLL